jgi:hypothetical protein
MGWRVADFVGIESKLAASRQFDASAIPPLRQHAIFLPRSIGELVDEEITERQAAASAAKKMTSARMETGPLSSSLSRFDGSTGHGRLPCSCSIMFPSRFRAQWHYLTNLKKSASIPFASLLFQNQTERGFQRATPRWQEFIIFAVNCCGLRQGS